MAGGDEEIGLVLRGWIPVCWFAVVQIVVVFSIEIEIRHGADDGQVVLGGGAEGDSAATGGLGIKCWQRFF